MASPGTSPTSGRPYSGPVTNADPTTEPGQYPPGPDWSNAIFGGQLPTGTGAPGSPTSAEAPGTQGTVPDVAGNNGTAMTYTKASDGIGPYEQVTSSDELSGPQDSTQANDDGYATGGPQLPGLKGNEPQAGSGRYQPGGGHVMRGGRAVRG